MSPKKKRKAAASPKKSPGAAAKKSPSKTTASPSSSAAAVKMDISKKVDSAAKKKDDDYTFDDLKKLEWSDARIKAFLGRASNPNAYYYRFNAPGEAQVCFFAFQTCQVFSLASATKLTCCDVLHKFKKCRQQVGGTRKNMIDS